MTETTPQQGGTDSGPQTPLYMMISAWDKPPEIRADTWPCEQVSAEIGSSGWQSLVNDLQAGLDRVYNATPKTDWNRLTLWAGLSLIPTGIAGCVLVVTGTTTLPGARVMLAIGVVLLVLFLATFGLMRWLSMREKRSFRGLAEAYVDSLTSEILPAIALKYPGVRVEVRGLVGDYTVRIDFLRCRDGAQSAT